MICRCRTYLLSFLLLFVFSAAVHAQAPLPAVGAVSDKAVNYLTWTNQYDGVKNIAIQRSPDSTYNWTVIGYVKNLKKGPEGFIDGHPLPGRNWYRLEIVFASDLSWFSNSVKLFVDSSDLKKQRVLPPNDSLQRYVGKLVKTDTTHMTGVDGSVALTIAIPDINAADAYSYIKSQYVFTDPFTSHVNVQLPDTKDHKYTIQFYDAKNNKVLFIPRVALPSIILDKRNFQRKGIYRFEVMENATKFDAGYITIY